MFIVLALICLVSAVITKSLPKMLENSYEDSVALLDKNQLMSEEGSITQYFR